MLFARRTRSPLRDVLAFVLLINLCGSATLLSAPKVGMTPDGRATIGDQPVFFIGFNHGPPIDLKTPEGGDGWKEMADGGMFVVRAGIADKNWTPENIDQFGEYLDTAWKHGVRVWPMLGELVRVDKKGNRDLLTQFINRFKDHPGIFFWKSTDEPEWGKVPVQPLREAYELIHKLDGTHPVWFCHAPRGTMETLRPYNDACDVLSIDIYPVSEPPGKHSLESNKQLSMVGDYTKRVMDLAEGKKIPFMVLQACWSGANPKHNPKNRLMFPTFREERYMMYQAIINGSNGLAFFGMPVGLTGRDEELGWNWTFWRAVLRPLLCEIKPGSEVYPMLISPDSHYPLQFTGAPQIEVRCKEAGVYLYIFAAAREGPTQTVTFSGLQDGEVTVLHENRTLEARGGLFTDTFAPHDVHVYRALRVMPPVTSKPGN